MTDVHASLSIVIPSKNRIEDISRLLRSIAAQPTQPDQIVVVDQSERPYALPASVVHHYDPSLRGLTAARNAGIARTNAAYVLMFDDDCELISDVVAVVKRTFAAFPDAVAVGCVQHVPPEVAALIVPQRPTFGLAIRLPFAISGLWNRVFAHGFFGNTVPAGQLPLAPGAAAAYRASLFAHELFDEGLTGYGYGEDWEFSKRARRHGTIRPAPDAVVIHHYSPANRDANRKMAQDRWRNWLYFYDKLGAVRRPADRFWRWWWMAGETLLWLRRRYGWPSEVWRVRRRAR